jgi:CRISPR/Cas system-associated protein Cas7 (RAMP superfamily)|tara:strand:- start:313 stop:549 length:237 start_codon:yes stop_codon:yes gene_type:complete
MLTPKKTLDTYYLEARRDLLEVAAMLDRYDRSVEQVGEKAEDESRLNSLLEALALLSEKNHAEANRTEQLLVHFSKVS